MLRKNVLLKGLLKVDMKKLLNRKQLQSMLFRNEINLRIRRNSPRRKSATKLIHPIHTN